MKMLCTTVLILLLSTGSLFPQKPGEKPQKSHTLYFSDIEAYLQAGQREDLARLFMENQQNITSPQQAYILAHFYLLNAGLEEDAEELCIAGTNQKHAWSLNLLGKIRYQRSAQIL